MCKVADVVICCCCSFRLLFWCCLVRSRAQILLSYQIRDHTQFKFNHGRVHFSPHEMRNLYKSCISLEITTAATATLNKDKSEQYEIQESTDFDVVAWFIVFVVLIVASGEKCSVFWWWGPINARMRVLYIPARFFHNHPADESYFPYYFVSFKCENNGSFMNRLNRHSAAIIILIPISPITDWHIWPVCASLVECFLCLCFLFIYLLLLGISLFWMFHFVGYLQIMLKRYM